MSNDDPKLEKPKAYMPFLFSRLVPALSLILFLLLGYHLFQSRPYTEPPVTSQRTIQEADPPFGIPLDFVTADEKTAQAFLPFFHFLNPWEQASIPVTDGFEMPLGSESGAFSYNAQEFWNLYQKYGGHHSGDDLNGIGGNDSDLGDPIHAVANGMVVYAGNPSPGWGNTVILAHRLPDGSIYHSMYAHMLEIHASLKSIVSRGSVVGTVGKADVGYLAHLHFEIRKPDEPNGVAPFMGGYPRVHAYDRINPSAFILERNLEVPYALSPPVLGLIQKNKPRPEIEFHYAQPLDKVPKAIVIPE